MAYEGTVELISGIRPKNDRGFPLVDAPDVRVTDDERLDAALAATVRFDRDQVLTDAQKARARENIDAGKVDPTLSVEGMAADAKMTGDAISGLKDGLSDLSIQLIDGNAYDVLRACNHFSGFHNGVQYTWSDDKESLTAVGTTADVISVRVLFDDANSFPFGMRAGGNYRLKHSATAIRLQVFVYVNGTLAPDPIVSMFSDREFTVPSDASGIRIRLAVPLNTEVNETIRPKLYTENLTNEELGVQLENIVPANNSVGSYAANSTANAVYNRFNHITEWLTHAYIDLNSGDVKQLSNTDTHTSVIKDFIAIPAGTQLHVHGGHRIGKYAADLTCIEVVAVTGLNTTITFDEASYVRIQYGSENQTILSTYVSYRYSLVNEAQGIDALVDNKCDGLEQSGVTIASTNGNPIVLTQCDKNKSFEIFEVSEKQPGENIVICGKNIFALRHTNGTFSKNGVNFQYNTIEHTVRIYSNGATADTISGFSEFGEDFRTVNGSLFYHNFKFCFPTSTIVSVKENANQDTPFDWGVQMRIYDGTNIINVGTGGTSFVAEANKEYVAYFLVKGPNTSDPGNIYPGWSGDITYSPQIEISPYPTAYEKFSGIKASLDVVGEENLFTCGEIAPSRFVRDDGAIACFFDSETNEICINARNSDNTSKIIYDPNKDGKVNGNDFLYISKFSIGRIAESLNDYVLNGGKLTLDVDDLESGQWSYSTKASNGTRIRTTSLIPVSIGTIVTYNNTTYDTLFGVLETASSNTYIQAPGWRTDGSGSFVVTVNGYMTFVARNHADPSQTINVSDFDSVITISSPNVPVFVKTFDNSLSRKVYAQLLDGDNIRTDHIGQGFFIDAEIGKEYGIRYGIREKASVNCVIKPIVATGLYALKEYGSRNETTVLYTDGTALLRIRQRQISTKSKAENIFNMAKAVTTLTGGHILSPYSKLLSRGPLVSFIDDDTSNYQYVKVYHDIFAAKNSVGGYAVETVNLDNGIASGLPDLLLDYEEEGFACLYHCYHQAGNETRYWIKGHVDYDQSLINENFMRGLRSIKEYGFSNYKYWVTPYGVNDKFIVDLAKNHGMQCLLNCPSRYAQEGYVSPYGNVSRWNIPRVIFGNYSTNDVWLHRAIQGAKAANGWVIIVSHVNSWGWGPADASGQRTETEAVTNMKTRLENLIQYCLDEGLEIVPFPVGFEEYRASFMLNELF